MSKFTKVRQQLTIPECFFNYLNSVYEHAQNGDMPKEECYKRIADMVISVLGPNFNPSIDCFDNFGEDIMAMEYAFMASEMINLLND